MRSRVERLSHLMLLTALVSFLVSAGLFAEEPAKAAPLAKGVLMGHVYDSNRVSPVRNVVVRLRNITTLKEYTSDPTGLGGLYEISGIEEGRYYMGVQTPKGSYNFQYSLFLKGNDTALLSVALTNGAFSPPVLQTIRNTYTQDAVANNPAKRGILGFFTSPIGIMTVVLAGEGVLYFTSLAEDEASPIR